MIGLSVGIMLLAHSLLHAGTRVSPIREGKRF